MSNDEINRIRVEAHKKHGAVRMVRLRTADGNTRHYVCSIRDGQILAILAGGDNEPDIIRQL